MPGIKTTINMRLIVKRTLMYLLLLITIISNIPAIFASVATIQDLDIDDLNVKFNSKKKQQELGEYPFRTIERYARMTEEVSLDSNRHEEALQALFGLMIFIEAVCKKALEREGGAEYASTWLSAIDILTNEAETTCSSDSETGLWYDRLFLKRTITFGKHTKTSESDSDSSSSSGDYVVNIYGATDLDGFSKSKMFKGEANESGDDNYSISGDEESINRPYYDMNEDEDEKEYHCELDVEHKAGSSVSSEENDKDDGPVRQQVNFAEFKRRHRTRRPEPDVNNNTEDSKESDVYNVNSNLKAAIGVSSNMIANTSNDGMIEKMKEELLVQIMAQLQAQGVQSQGQGQNRNTQVQTGQQTLQFVQDGSKLAADISDLPEMSRETVIEILRTSAIPKLLNSLIKDRFGVDVLKSLSMLLRVLNESLGSFEIILKLLIKLTRTVRFYVLLSSKVVAEMAQENNAKPLVDLSVPMPTDSLSTCRRKKKRFGLGGVTKMFQKGLKSAAGGQDHEEADPFSLSIEAAVSSANGYKSNFQEMPPFKLLKLFHTVFAQLEKRDGVIRVALTRKKHETLYNLQISITEAIKNIYEAVIVNDPNYLEPLKKLKPEIFTDIIMSLISSVDLNQLKLDEHIMHVTEPIKLLMSVLDQDAQLKILNSIFEDESEIIDSMFTGKKRAVRAKQAIHWTSSTLRK